MLDVLTRGPTFATLVCYLCLINAFCPQNSKTGGEWARRVLGALTAAALAVVAFYYLVNPSNASTVLEQPVCILLVWLYAMFVLKMRPGEAFYATTLSALIGESMGMLIQRLSWGIHLEPRELELLLSVLLYVALAAAVAFVVRRFVARLMLHDGAFLISRKKLIFTALVLMLYLVLANYQLIFWLLGGSNGTTIIVLAFRVVVGFLAVMILFLQNDIDKRQKTQQELEILSQMWHRQQSQYKLSQENIEIINRKCHDLRHQMAALRQLQDKAEIDRQVAEMEKAVMIYDSVVRTGNPVLDVVLTEKSLYCEANEINMTCLVDGKLLSFVDTVDLYTLFGNALDNAIESVVQQEDKQKRVIQVAAYQEQNMLLIRIRNYCEQAPELVDGLPATTKEDSGYHGFGLKSIRHTAEKYGGGISIQTGSNFFSLQILIPKPQEN